MSERNSSESRTGRRLIIGTVLALAAAAGVKYGPESVTDRITSWHDACGQLKPFYKPEESVVVSCSAYADRTTQKEVRNVFTFTPVPHSVTALAYGDYGVAVYMKSDPGVPFKLFGESDNFSLTDWDAEMQSNEELRAVCVADMSHVVDFVQQHAEAYAGSSVSGYELGTAENAYDVGPAGRGNNDQTVPDLFILDAASGKPLKESIAACWSP